MMMMMMKNLAGLEAAALPPIRFHAYALLVVILLVACVSVVVKEQYPRRQARIARSAVPDIGMQCRAFERSSPPTPVDSIYGMWGRHGIEIRRLHDRLHH